MEQTLEKTNDVDPHVEPASTPLRQYSTEYNEFSYRPVPVIAVVGVVLALLSSVAIFFWLALPLCAIAFVVSTLAFFVIRRNKTVYSGTLIALGGMLMSLGFLAGGIAYQVHLFQNEVPEGYEKINFIQDISDKGFITKNGREYVHPDILALDGKKIFLKSYIYQTGKLKGLESFLVVKDNQSCCFGADPAIEDRVGVIMQKGKSIDYKSGKIGIAGTFHLNKNFTNNGEREPLFMIDGEYFTSRVSDFK